MFLRYKPVLQQFCTWERWGREIHDWYATDVLLVESVRTPQGPRQRHVAYLGRLPLWGAPPTPEETARHGIMAAPFERERQRTLAEWWRKVELRLDRQGDRITPGQRADVLARLEERVPRPTG